MNLKIYIWQFAKDGLVGLLITTLGFGILWITLGSRIGLYFYQGPFIVELFRFYGLMFSFQDSFISPMPSVILIGFISMGIGGRFLENIASRWNLLKLIFTIAVSAWIIGVILFQISYIEYGFDWDVVGITAAGAGAGFLIAGLAGVIFNPTKRFFRLIIGATASTIVASTVGLWIVASQIMQ